MKEMSKRERVEAVLNFQEPDRVPLYDLLRNDAVIEYYAGEKLTTEEGVRIACKAIGRCLDMTRSIRGPAVPDRIADEDGFVWYQERWTSWIEQRPFHDLQGATAWIKKDIRRKEEWQPDRSFKDKFRKDFLELQAMVGDTVILLTQSPVGLDYAYRRLGWELFSYMLADDPGLISEWLETLANYEIRRAHAIADRELSPVVLTYADIAYKGKTLFSPQFLRKEMFGRLGRLNEAWHEHGIKCLFHSDGYLMNILPDLIEAGIDGLNPIEIVAGMDLKEVKEKYGHKIFISGGIDVSELLPFGTPDEVKEACRAAIEAAGKGSGYFLGSTTELHNGVPLENAITMFESVK